VERPSKGYLPVKMLIETSSGPSLGIPLPRLSMEEKEGGI
jgi:hypothetical protein